MAGCHVPSRAFAWESSHLNKPSQNALRSRREQEDRNVGNQLQALFQHPGEAHIHAALRGPMEVTLMHGTVNETRHQITTIRRRLVERWQPGTLLGLMVPEGWPGRWQG